MDKQRMIEFLEEMAGIMLTMSMSGKSKRRLEALVLELDKEKLTWDCTCGVLHITGGDDCPACGRSEHTSRVYCHGCQWELTGTISARCPNCGRVRESTGVKI